MRIIVVDDKEEERYLSQTLLKGSGYEVETAANGAEALEKLRAEGFGMIVSDVLMPVMDGFRLCRECKEDEKLKDIPFIFYTATYKDERDEELASKVGADRFIRKPVEPEEFVKIIQGVFRDIEEGKIGPKRRVLEEETEVFKLYSERLIAKLEKKMLELEAEITERKQAEEELTREKERTEEYLNIAGVMLSIVSADENITLMNNKGCETMGYKEEELIGKNWFDTLVPQSIREKVRSVFRTLMTGDIEPVEYYENPLLTKDGEERLIAFHNTVIRERNGTIVGVLTSGEDITERKRAEERALFLADALERSSQPFAVGYPDGRLMIFNTAYCELLGYNREELHELKWDTNLTPPEWREVVAKVAEEIIRTRQPQHFEKEYIRKDGSRVPVEVFAHPIFDSKGDLEYLYSFFTDTTERKQAEAKTRELQVLREVDHLRSQLLANISHELRTPLTSIKGFTSTLLRTDVEWSEEEQRDYLQTIDQESDRLVRLISDLLDMSRIEAGGLKLEKDNYHISEILDSVGGRLATLTERHQLQVIIPSDLPPVFVDQMRIGQVLINLVENATKYSSQGSLITIEAQLAGDQIIVSVTDRGEGIPPELLDKVFDRFYQAEGIVTGRKSGTGLGLSICRGIIESHGGKIWVESKLGEGSKFSFSLPVGKGEEEIA